MAHCEHCGTEYSPRNEADRYCCQGCEFVAQLIDEQGFERFYELKQDQALAPVRSRPFEQHDFSWVDERLAESERQAGGEGKLASLTFGLEGISCVGCVWLIEKLFERQPGSVRAMASPSQGRMTLEWLAGRCAVKAFLEELCRFGYVATPPGPLTVDRERGRLVVRLGLCGAFALNTMGFSLPVYLGMPDDFEFAGLFRLIAMLSATLSMLVGGGYFIERAWRAWRAGSMHIDLPIALGLLAAYAGSIVGWMLGKVQLMYFDFVSTFVFLMLAGRYVQTAAVERNRRRLMRQQPVPQSLATEAGAWIDRGELANGIRFWLEPGQALPISSVLVEGAADFSLEWINGESEPQRLEAGCRLPGGAILLSRSRTLFMATEAWNGSLLSKLVAEHQGERTS
ncbi:MAG TPA: heavy metal translocating P-type ATPase metal-binding domain-containing protein, partial [Luteolibacter sp.]|nr:heavy metal translocating P-type ATPase metal-binding domain-containing protein [Luteolibacter sp.]